MFVLGKELFFFVFFFLGRFQHFVQMMDLISVKAAAKVGTRYLVREHITKRSIAKI
jgi:hypothetical protein